MCQVGSYGIIGYRKGSLCHPLTKETTGPHPDFFTMDCQEIMASDAGYNLWIEKLVPWLQVFP